MPKVDRRAQTSDSGPSAGHVEEAGTSAVSGPSTALTDTSAADASSAAADASTLGEPSMDLADVDRDAPVLASAEADIQADPAIVWAVLADIVAWPEWNPAVRSASLPGDLRVGATFRWAAGPGTITSRLVTVDPPRLLAWTGRSMGLRAAHAWRVAPSTDGSSVRTEESLSGLPARLFAGRLRRTLRADLEAWVRLLKLESESRAADEDAVGSRVTESSADEADTEQARAEEPRAEEPRAEEPRAEEPRSGEARAGEARAGGSGADEAAPQEPSS